MKRDIEQLKCKHFDVLIIGAGSHGACAARDAALRGLKVAMVDKGDLCGATSHNSLKTIHGGIRYLQHLNFKRTLESIKEQKIWLRTAPHLVKPLAFLMPTYGHGMRGPLAMLAGINLFRLFGFGRNKHLNPDRKLPAGRVVSKQRCIELAPNIKQQNLTGGAIWYDAQIEQADRAVMQISQHAHELGAVISNYIQVDRLLLEDKTVTGAQATDLISGEQFTIQAKTVLNAAGPWASELLDTAPELAIDTALIKSMNLVTTLTAPNMAVAVQSRLESDSVVGSTKRLYFIVPWLGRAVIGTTHFPFEGKVDQLSIDSAEIAAFVKEINAAYPSLNVQKADLLYCYQGLAPAGDDHPRTDDKKNALRLHESKVIDHASEHQINGVISIFSVKWTTARLIAERAVDMVVQKLGVRKPGNTATEPLIDSLELPYRISELGTPDLINFCHRHIEHSMVQNLSDLLLRRTNDVVLDLLSLEQVRVLAHSMRDYFDWDHEQQAQQIRLLQKHYLPETLRENLQQEAFWAP